MIESSVRVGRIDSVFVTHLHGDHVKQSYVVLSINILVLRVTWIGNEVNWTENRGYKTICSIWSKIISWNLDHSVTVSSIQCSFYLFSNKSFLLNEIVPSLSKKSLEMSVNPVIIDKSTGSYLLTRNELFSVTAVPIKHTVFCLGYIIQESDQRGRIDAELLTNEFKVPPGPIYKELIAGKSIRAPDGREITPEMVMGKARRPRKIVILGDTYDPSSIIDHAMDADVLIHESTCCDEDVQIALSKGHSTAGMAGEFARKIRAKHLILNHFSPRGFRPNEYEESKNIRALLQQARDKFQSDFVYAARVTLSLLLFVIYFL